MAYMTTEKEQERYLFVFLFLLFFLGMFLRGGKELAQLGFEFDENEGNIVGAAQFDGLVGDLLGHLSDISATVLLDEFKMRNGRKTYVGISHSTGTDCMLEGEPAFFSAFPSCPLRQTASGHKI